MKVDILICGAGPAGLTLAIECARQGLSFLIFDKVKERSAESKALAIWNNTLEVFDNIGVIDGFIKKGVPLKELFFYSEGLLKAVIPLGEKIPSPYKFPLILPQNETEILLETELKRLGGHVYYGHELISFKETESGIDALLYGEGKELTISVLWLIGSDGPHSTVRRQAAIDFEGYAEKPKFALADVEFTSSLKPSTAFFSWSPGAPLAIFPLPDGRFRLVVERRAQDPLKLQEIEELLENCGLKGLSIKKAFWLSSFLVSERVAKHFTKGRIFLIGDAAHIHSPAGGQGMNMGIQDAYNLGWKLNFLIKYPQKAALIAGSYEKERRPVILKVVKAAARKQKVATCRIKWLKKLALFLLSSSSWIQRKMASDLYGFNVVYRSGLILTDGTKLRWLTVKGHTLFINGIERPNSFPDWIHLEVTDKIASHSWLFVRPDQVVAAKGSTADFKLFECYWKKLSSEQ